MMIRKISVFACMLAVSLFMHTLSVSPTIEDATTALPDAQETLIAFSYENEDLINIINTFAELTKTNILLPQADQINSKVTLHLPNKLTVNEGWDLLKTLIDIAGFTLVPHETAVHIIKNPGKEISREPMPTYIGVSLDKIPKTDEYIRYLYFLANIRVSDASENELNGLLKELLPESSLFKTDQTTNGILLVAKAKDIHAIMKIIIELDTVNFQEKVDIFQLNHTSANIVAQLLTEQILKADTQNPYRLDSKKAKDVPYFSSFTKVVPEERLNRLIIAGKAQAVDRLKAFIQEYIDVPPDSGKSTLHVYRLQYLDAIQFVPVLKSIVEGSQFGGVSQARSGEKVVHGTERFFEEVIIMADKPSAETDELKYYGGNKIIVSARNDDWKQLKKIIEELDQPSKQVLLEILIADLTVDDTKFLGSMTRIPAKIPFPDSMTFQSPQLGLQPIPNQLPDPTSLDADLLQKAYTKDAELGKNVGVDQTATQTVAHFARPGTTMLSLNDNDGRTWSILEIQKACTNSKILSHPHVMATNNKEASVKIGEQRFLPDASSGSLGGTTVILQKPIDALLEVKITPRISTDNTVNLQVLVTINEFIDTAASGNNTQTTRNLETNANIQSGGIFALGGLIKNTTINGVSEVPFLGKIPILKWFFKQRNAEVLQNNLTVFICPTIIEPRLRGGVNEYTSDYIDMAKQYAGEELFSNLKDPITHWFFRSPEDSDEVINTYVNRTQKYGEQSSPVYQDKPKTKEKEETKIHKTEVIKDTKEDLFALKMMLENDPNPFMVSQNTHKHQPHME